MAKKVVILGGGVAGMSAAHELIRRGFEVDVYELLSIPGGKARSIPVPGSGTKGRGDLPGEHGFRFFPRFYQNIIETMKQIPNGNEGKTVFDNLVYPSMEMMAFFNSRPLYMPTEVPRTLPELIEFLKTFLKDLINMPNGLTKEDIEFFGERVWQIVTSCDARRFDQYERIGWWEFVGANERNATYQDIFAKGLTRSLVAAKANLANARTVGDMYVKVLYGELLEGGTDRVLNGPTNDAWIDPWLKYLRGKGVNYNLNSEVTSINLNEDGIIAGVTIENKDTREVFEAEGDYYIAAFPSDVMSRILDKNPGLLTADASLASIQKIYTSWMNGFQVFLNTDVEIVNGHTIYINSPWSLTSVSEAQFWSNFDWSKYGDGKAKGVISIDISNWDDPGVIVKDKDGNFKTATQCTPDEIKEEVWGELKLSLNKTSEVIKDEYYHSYFLDPDIVYTAPNDPSKKINTEPLMVNLVNSWSLRPTAFTNISNLFLASDYIQTDTDLASMEGANEAARRAVNSILQADGSSEYCKVYKFKRPDWSLPWRIKDEIRYAAGRPWDKSILNEKEF